MAKRPRPRFTEYGPATEEELAAQREGYARNYRPGPRQAQVVAPAEVIEQHTFEVGQLRVEEYEEADWSSLHSSREERLRYSPASQYVMPDFSGKAPSRDELERRMLRRLTATFLKGQPVHREAISVPATWWEHFKRDVVAPLCARLGLRAPRVRLTELRKAETFHMRACPHLVRRAVRDESHVRFLLGRDEPVR